MTLDIKKQIINKIKEYQTIIISRHIRPDGDAYGSSRGLKELILSTFPNKNVYVVNEDYSDELAFLGEEDKITLDVYNGALGIIVDTGASRRISNKNYNLCKEIIKIDHHILADSYGDIVWIDEERSSCAELIAELWYDNQDVLVMNKKAATLIYLGMVTDTGRFQYEGVNAKTLRIASYLLEYGVDITDLYANLYIEDVNSLKFKGYVYNNIQLTQNGVAYIYVDKAMQEKFGLTLEQASDIVSSLSRIKGSLIWIAFIDNVKENTVRVRIRSRYLSINGLAMNYRGGGHDTSAGATLLDASEIQPLLADADKLLKDYKENNEGWL